MENEEWRMETFDKNQAGNDACLKSFYCWVSSGLWDADHRENLGHRDDPDRVSA